LSQLVVNEIHKSFKHRHVVKGVSFEVSSNSIVGLLGPNGAGKTTSFYMVVGLVTPDKGQITVDDVDITKLPIYKRAQQGISYLPQEPSVFRKLTVRENIQVAIDAQNLTGSVRQETLERLLNEFSLNHITESYGYALSGGERRRVEIARSLVGKPKFLLLDEPFAGIDPIAVYDIQQIIRKLRDQGIGILITDHNVRETLGICDFSYIMKDGAVQVKGSPEAITKSELARKFYLGENFRL
jgi:lipopolysaccharide export system ATP-binding protein